MRKFWISYLMLYMVAIQHNTYLTAHSNNKLQIKEKGDGKVSYCIDAPAWPYAHTLLWLIIYIKIV